MGTSGSRVLESFIRQDSGIAKWLETLAQEEMNLNSNSSDAEHSP